METINLSDLSIPQDPNESQNYYCLRTTYTYAILQLYPKTPVPTAILLGRIKLSKIQFNVSYSREIEDFIKNIDQNLSIQIS